MANSKTISSNDWLSFTSFLVLLFAMIAPIGEGLLIAFAVVFLAVGISSAVHSAEVIAERVGPSLGTLILAISVTVIEVALIVSLMSNDTADSPQIARDTVFAALMIVTNGIIGICILLGGLKHKELGFQSVGTTALLGVLAVLSTLTLILPLFTTTTNRGTYSAGQLIFVSLASLVLYGSLVWSQTKSHKNFFAVSEEEVSQPEISGTRPSKKRAVTSFISLLFSLVAVVGLSKILSPTIESTIAALGAPKAVVGIVIAILVLAPETLAAMNAAKINELQTSLNLALGSGAASIALTIPAVSLYSLMFDKPLTLGLDSKGIVFLMVTFLAGSFTFGSGRTTSLHGLIHLVIMASFLAISLMP
ncbi:ionic transporter y4hA [Leptospira congkakensis]|uniref:Ionic transporter y4hA n=1 Tax=Leptospira congkakensis TaxID=2484932 RepID=A0A4Z0ZYW3_9LEPT|nr:ionic transporter y4hA [Leptospira congkakensis]TGL86220.1 ionic transporter y4hA [Leptospira congkakensis]TGL94236.1 ionic transporter y4hA [Leptospira congkakensis]TGL94354.1 ionic transporter y4hA [Leptospira congkakensis]